MRSRGTFAAGAHRSISFIDRQSAGGEKRNKEKEGGGEGGKERKGKKRERERERQARELVVDYKIIMG